MSQSSTTSVRERPFELHLSPMISGRAELRLIEREWTSLEQYLGVPANRAALWPKSWQVIRLWLRTTLLFLLGATPIFAQQYSLEVSQYRHTSWTAQDGFFNGGIASIAQTSDGYLWVASGSGALLRFDGARFVEWKPPGNDSLPGNPLLNLLGSRDGSLWIAG